MPSKKKGKKKSTATTDEPKSSTKTIAADSVDQANSISDISPFLFDDSPLQETALPHDLPFIGPIALVDQRQCDSDGPQVVHGRGLVVTRDVSPGECLFITPALVSAPVDKVRKHFLERHGTQCSNGEQVAGCGYGEKLEAISEQLLLEQVKSVCQNPEHDSGNEERRQKIFDSFLSQMSSDDVPKTEMDVLLAKSSVNSDNDGENFRRNLDNETILGIIRKNAFGPDYHSYDVIANWWLNNSTNPDATSVYGRLLGVYPLAAMVNHSCFPNAVRIFGSLPSSKMNKKCRSLTTQEDERQEFMIVHSSTALTKGTEIRWSYLPPTTPFNPRRKYLKAKYGFDCQCARCINEQEVNSPASPDEWIQLSTQLDGWWESRRANLPQHPGQIVISPIIQSLEQCFTSRNLISSEVQRFMRVGYASIYMDFFNEALASPSIKGSQEKNDEISNLLKLATQLHFSFVSCNNASTEHLSILHLCYELVSVLHTRALSYPDTVANTMPQIKFWTEQLKKAHMVRYGSLGEKLENVRFVMKHTKVVLRNRDGWYTVRDHFI
eukprot:CCRYP_000183-RA/>CCRYP_000183-RA protein AED:0.00 eAED:0.00 QI:324/-1/1/1/-1/1/1/183/551